MLYVCKYVVHPTEFLKTLNLTYSCSFFSPLTTFSLSARTLLLAFMQSKWISAYCAQCHPDKQDASSYSGISKPHSASQQIHNKISRTVALPLSAVYYVCLSLSPLFPSRSFTHILWQPTPKRCPTLAPVGITESHVCHSSSPFHHHQCNASTSDHKVDRLRFRLSLPPSLSHASSLSLST